MSIRAERIRKLVYESGKSYKELEKITGIARSSLQRYATGVTKKIPLDAIEKLADAFGVSQAYIMGLDEPIGSDEIHRKNNIAVDILMRLGEDKDFAETVELLYKMDAEQLRNVKNMLAGFIQ